MAPLWRGESSAVRARFGRSAWRLLRQRMSGEETRYVTKVGRVKHMRVQRQTTHCSTTRYRLIAVVCMPVW